jgi:hypothetical protein
MIRVPVAALAFAASTALLAQSQAGGTSETGTLITRHLAQVHGETTLAARKTLREFGTCVVNKMPGIAEDAIDQPVDTKSFHKTLVVLADEDCFSSGELTMPKELLRGAVLEAMYLREFARGPRADLKTAPTFNYAAPYSRPFSGEAQNTIGLAIMGDCVTRTAQDKAHELVTTIPGSPPEDRAIGAIAKYLPGCIPPMQTIRLSRSIIRGSVAEALLRLSRLTQQQASASK